MHIIQDKIDSLQISKNNDDVPCLKPVVSKFMNTGDEVLHVVQHDCSQVLLLHARKLLFWSEDAQYSIRW